jgi:hypothetical protein
MISSKKSLLKSENGIENNVDGMGLSDAANDWKRPYQQYSEAILRRFFLKK